MKVTFILSVTDLIQFEFLSIVFKWIYIINENEFLLLCGSELFLLLCKRNFEVLLFRDNIKLNLTFPRSFRLIGIRFLNQFINHIIYYMLSTLYNTLYYTYIYIYIPYYNYYICPFILSSVSCYWSPLKIDVERCSLRPQATSRSNICARSTIRACKLESVHLPVLLLSVYEMFYNPIWKAVACVHTVTQLMMSIFPFTSSSTVC